MNNNPLIIFAVERNQLLVYIRRVSDHTWSPLNEYIHRNPGISHCLLAIPALVWLHSLVHPMFSPALRRISKLITITLMVLLYSSSEIPVTPKAGRNALLWSESLLKLTLWTLHSTSSQILLEASSDWNAFCWCNSGLFFYTGTDDADPKTWQSMQRNSLYQIIFVANVWPGSLLVSSSSHCLAKCHHGSEFMLPFLCWHMNCRIGLCTFRWSSHTDIMFPG